MSKRVASAVVVAVLGVCSAAVTTTSAEEARAKEIVQKAVAAMGGSDRIASVKDVVSTGKVTLQTPMGEVAGEATSEVVFPDRMRSTITLPMGRIVQAFDGTTAWMTINTQSMDVPPTMVNELRRGIITAGGIALLRKALSGEARVDALDAVALEGRKADVLSWKEGEIELRAFYDAETHLLAKLEYKANTPQGPTDVEVMPSDFRDVDGLKIPFKVVGTQNGQKYLELIATEVKVNAGVDASVFAKPAQ